MLDWRRPSRVGTERRVLFRKFVETSAACNVFSRSLTILLFIFNRRFSTSFCVAITLCNWAKLSSYIYCIENSSELIVSKSTISLFISDMSDFNLCSSWINNSAGGRYLELATWDFSAKACCCAWSFEKIFQKRMKRSVVGKSESFACLRRNADLIMLAASD